MRDFSWSPCCFRLAICEVAWLAWALGVAVAAEIVDAAMSWFGALSGLWAVLPGCVEDLSDSERLGKLLRREVVRVERHKAKSAAELGAGGTGTSRAWLTAYPRGLKLFAKLPAASAFERIFLTVFGVYQNELDMYAFVKRANYRPGLFADALCVSSRRARFVLLLEDLSRSRDAQLPSVADAHPVRRVKVALEALVDLHAPYFGQTLPLVGWTDEFSGRPTRPPFLRLVANATLKRVDVRFPGLLTPNGRAVYALFTDRFLDIRRAWSTMAPLTLVHGDAHLGNMFFYDGDSKAGFYDLQCVAAEHPMRDVVYHLLSSCDPADLHAGGEVALLEFYVDRLNAKTHGSAPKLQLDDAHFQYRVHAAWVLVAFVICAGASDLFTERMARLTISRICDGIDRLDTFGALNLLLLRSNKTNKLRAISP